MPAIRMAPDFALGGVRLSGLRGRPVLIAFIYTSCASACPLLSLAWRGCRRSSSPRGLPAVLLSVTVDPQRDDAKKLALFARGFGARPGWHFLRGEPARLAPVLAAYDEWTQVLPSGELDHPARLHLIDAAGRVREIYSLPSSTRGRPSSTSPPSKENRTDPFTRPACIGSNIPAGAMPMTSALSAEDRIPRARSPGSARD